MNALQHNCPSTARTGRSNPYAAQNQTQRVTVRLNFGDPRASLGKGVFRGKRHLLSQPCSAAGDFGHGEGAALENGLSKQYSPCDSHDFDPAPAHPVPGPDASWGQEVEQLRSLIEAAWVAGGDGEWAAQLVEQRAQQRAEAVRRALWPLLPREKQYTLGELLLFDRLTMYEKVRLALGYGFGVQLKQIRPYTLASDLASNNLDRFTRAVKGVMGLDLSLEPEDWEGLTVKEVAEKLYDSLKAERDFWC